MRDSSAVAARLTLLNSLGLHVRAAAVFVKTLSGLNAEVQVSWEGRTVNGRSLLDLMTLGAPQGSVLDIEASGADAATALEALTKVIENRFYEE